jgi:hypothetical protein
MNRFADGLIAYRILKMMVTNFEDTEAYKLGIIDKKGKNLKKVSDLRTGEEKDAYSILVRLVFNMKKIINRLPGGESKLKSLVAAMFLVKEQYEQGGRPNVTLMEQRYNSLMGILDDGVILVEEEIALRKFMKELEEEAPANSGGAGIALGGEKGANTGTVAGMDLPLKSGKLAKRKKPVEFTKGKDGVN